MDQRGLFHAQLKSILKPALVADGFRASGMIYRRVMGDVIHLIKIQGSRDGGRCCVCLGIHLAFLPTVLGDKCIPNKISEPDCEFRSRLAPVGDADCWWDYGCSVDEARRSVMAILKLYQEVGRPYFSRFSAFPNDFSQVTPAMLVSGEPLPFPEGDTLVRFALALSRIALRIGRTADAKAFAEYGLAEAKFAVGLRGEFRKLLAAI